jgi:LemA protein
MGKIALVIIGVILAAALLIGFLAFGGYNSLTQKGIFVDAKWAEVENMMQRRADLIPNIVATVKGYAKQEESIFTKIAEARSRLLAAASPEAKIDANNQLTQAMRDGGLLGTGGRFLQIAEQYPQLKSDTGFLKLQDELAGTENRMANSRREYNEAVTDYNTTRRTFPTVLIAGLMGFQDKPFFKADEGAKTAPKVDFNK